MEKITLKTMLLSFLFNFILFSASGFEVLNIGWNPHDTIYNKTNVSFLKKNDVVILDSVFVVNHGAEIEHSAVEKIDCIYNLLMANKNIDIEIKCSGIINPSNSSFVPLVRAGKIEKYLITKGIAAARIKCVGVSCIERPMNPEKVRKILRVEIKIIKK